MNGAAGLARPRTATSVAQLRSMLDPVRVAGRSVGFVPTMGALHAGHAALMRAAVQHCDVAVASCYVNPLQFGANEDLVRYPHTPEVDLAVAAEAGIGVLWLPGDEDVHGCDAAGAPEAAGPLGAFLEGAARPGHFDGVAAVVARLLAAVRPDVLFLGEKDFQQLAVVRALVARLALPVEVRGVPTVRDADGLALSSRNAHLGSDERRAALALPRALDAAQAAVAAGAVAADEVLTPARAALRAEPLVGPDYVELVDPVTLVPVDRLDRGAVLLLAARIGSTRLIDNRRLTPPHDRIEDQP